MSNEFAGRAQIRRRDASWSRFDRQLAGESAAAVVQMPDLRIREPLD
jgi:hypothetical protein